VLSDWSAIPQFAAFAPKNPASRIFRDVN